MSPVTHFLVGWVLANGAINTRRDRAFIAVAEVIPDVDGLGVAIDYLRQDHALTLWSTYHHVLAHNLSFGILIFALGLWLMQWRWKTAMLALISFHLHLIGDLIGSRSPDGYQWPIPYLYPFSAQLMLSWQGQWALNAWPNFVITAFVLLMTFYLAWSRGYSPLEMISTSADKQLVATLRSRF